MPSSRGDDPALPENIVRRMFEEYSQGRSPRDIAKMISGDDQAPSRIRPIIVSIPKDSKGRRAFEAALQRLNGGGADEPGND